jgi:beta-lactamase class A
VGEPGRRADREGRLKLLLAVVAALVAGAITAPALDAASKQAGYPWEQRVKAAERFADSRAGRISFAAVDENGDTHGSHIDRVHNSASVVKVLFMVTLLRQSDVRHDDLTDTERRQLKAMITHSDNAAATAIYERVGQAALYRVAHEIGLDHFTTQPTWGLTTITAGSQARFMYRIERYLPKRHRAYAMRLLTEIVRRQRWGIPPVAPRGWKLYFKGGWSGRPSWRINQVMLLRKRPRRFSIAILTREQPSKEYGEHSIEGVAKRLLRGFS